MSRVVVAMSGGVDSAVAAALLVDQGHDVTGVHLKLADVPDAQQVVGHGCCSLDDASDARRIAQVLGIDYYVWDFREPFAADVQTPFINEYARGRTPNPCISCNERVKYAALLERAIALGFDALATGHHVRLRHAEGTPVVEPGVETGRAVELWRAVDGAKDQSYVLWMASQWQLARSLFPIGEITKAQVRASAERFGLRVASKPDSHDICFIPDRDTAGWLGRHLPVVRGEIVHVDGRVLGQHDGIWHFTVGQRRGLGLDHHERLFVVDVDAGSNRVRVGPRDALAVDTIRLDDVSWTSGAAPDDEREVDVQLRAHGRPLPGRVEAADGTAVLRLAHPAHGVARGQSAAIYSGHVCLGGGRIASSQLAARSRPSAVTPG